MLRPVDGGLPGRQPGQWQCRSVGQRQCAGCGGDQLGCYDRVLRGAAVLVQREHPDDQATGPDPGDSLAQFNDRAGNIQARCDRQRGRQGLGKHALTDMVVHRVERGRGNFHQHVAGHGEFHLLGAAELVVANCFHGMLLMVMMVAVQRQ